MDVVFWYNQCMLKIYRGQDNIAFISDQVSSTEHSHCLLQVFLSFDEPLSLAVEDETVIGKCVIVNKNVKHVFSCKNRKRLSILLEPASNFAKELASKMDGKYMICDQDKIETLQQKAAMLEHAAGQEQYLRFVRDFAEFFNISGSNQILDERITELLVCLQDCDCYDHTIENFANKVSLSSSHLSHLFREQIGVSLKSYILFHQLEKAFTAFLNGKSITDAAMLAGFNSPSHFAATVKKWMGVSVSSYKKDSEFLKVLV